MEVDSIIGILRAGALQYVLPTPLVKTKWGFVRDCHYSEGTVCDYGFCGRCSALYDFVVSGRPGCSRLCISTQPDINPGSDGHDWCIIYIVWNAGLVLTVGMAVDANVLIFERIREELADGAGLRRRSG